MSGAFDPEQITWPHLVVVFIHDVTASWSTVMDVKLILLFLIIAIIVVLSSDVVEKLRPAYQQFRVRLTGRRYHQP